MQRICTGHKAEEACRRSGGSGGQVSDALRCAYGGQGERTVMGMRSHAFPCTGRGSTARTWERSLYPELMTQGCLRSAHGGDGGGRPQPGGPRARGPMRRKTQQEAVCGGRGRARHGGGTRHGLYMVLQYPKGHTKPRPQDPHHPRSPRTLSLLLARLGHLSPFRRARGHGRRAPVRAARRSRSAETGSAWPPRRSSPEQEGADPSAHPTSHVARESSSLARPIPVCRRNGDRERSKRQP